MKAKMSQKKWTLNRLKERGRVTPMEAFEEFGIWRLPVCINRLRNDGVKIITKMVQTTSRIGEETEYAEYILVKGNE